MKASSGSKTDTPATIKNIAGFLNRTLRVPKINDASVNGLQVRSRHTGTVTSVGFAVDADLATIALAKEVGVELLVVHHGIRWRPRKNRDLEQKRADFLRKNNMALYAVHLPLDLHEEYGNNIQLSRMIGLTKLRKFGRYHGIQIGYAGTLGKAVSLNDLAATMDRGLNAECSVLRFGRERVKTVGIVSGGGGSLLQEAVSEKLDCYIVGEIDLAVYNAARDQRMNLIVAGHYATETAGVKALMPVLRETFRVRTVFVDEPKVW